MKMPVRLLGLIAGAGLLVSPAVVSAADPIKVTRFHLDQPIPPGAISVEMAPDAVVAPGPEAQLYLDAVASALAEQGFARTDQPSDAAVKPRYRLIVSLSRDAQELPRADPPVTLGLGGGGGNGGFGLGGGLSFGVGKRQPRTRLTTELSARMLVEDGQQPVWEGRATQTLIEKGKPAQPGQIADKLAHALFKGFPGESGRTISVK